MTTPPHCADSLIRPSLSQRHGSRFCLFVQDFFRACIPSLAISLALFLTQNSASAAAPGGGLVTAPNVTATDNGDGTVTLDNGIASIVIVTKTARLNSVTYTYDNGSGTRKSQMLAGAGQYYYGGFMLGNQQYVYSLETDPKTNGGNYADVKLLSSTDSNGVMEVHFSMLRGSPGYYSTAIMTHRAQDVAFSVGAWGVVTRVPTTFNWASADSTRNFFVGVQSTKGVKVPNSPHEITVNLDGTQQGEYADKFIYGQDHADQKAWGWSSVGPGGSNIGIWIMTNMDFSDGGPLKRDVGTYPYNNLNNSILTGELGMGSDGNLAAGEQWTKTAGPWFIYMNNVSSSVTDAAQAAATLYDDAVKRSYVEAAHWPYTWFTNSNYAPASDRGTVKGTLSINDVGNQNPTLAGTWIGLEEQPITNNGTYDFQKWLKPYQYWTQTDAAGNFTIPNVIAGSDYTLWAYGPGAAGTFLSQNLKGGNPPLIYDLPATPFTVSVGGGQVTDLGTVTWNASRVGATVFELGYPNRKADEFRHGEDFWAPDKSPALGYPTPVWGMQVQFPIDYPSGMTYTVGQSRWSRDWNYLLPSLADASGVYQPSTGTIQFDLASAPAGSDQASLYIGCAGDDGGKVVLSVNGSNLGSTPGVTATPNAITSSGFNPAYSDDSSIHFSDHGPFSDERITFPASLLHSGQNTLTIKMNATGLTAYLMLDYLRLELTNFIPPPPAQVTPYPGYNQVLLTWPAVPGAARYNILRSTQSGSGYVTISTGLLGSVAGSDQSLMTYTDTGAQNGQTYYYVVQSWNATGGNSGHSPESAAVTPSSALSQSVPSAPSGLTVASSSHHSVQLRWDSTPNADYYQVDRTTLYGDGNGHEISLRTIVLDDGVTSSTYTDNTPTDGATYSYYVKAVNAAGLSSESTAVQARTLPNLPSGAPSGLSGAWSSDGKSIKLKWTAVPGATGYVIYRSNQADSFKWPANFLTTQVETTYTDQDTTLSKSNVYYYRVTPVNIAGISASASVIIGQ